MAVLRQSVDESKVGLDALPKNKNAGTEPLPSYAGYTVAMTSWELQRNWDIVRYLVYYLVEDLVAADLIPGHDVIDFSAGLGDLSEYIYANKPKSLLATSPDDVFPPANLDGKPGFQFLPNVRAGEIQQKFQPSSTDLFLARMVFQFPTDEHDRIDVDGMLAQIYDVLRPGGRLIIASHEFTQMDDHLDDEQLSFEEYLQALPSRYTGKSVERIHGLIELIRSIGLPPREGVHGQTGFGLKGLMAVDSFVRCGFQIESAAEIEDFTFPVGMSEDLHQRPEYYRKLAEEVFAIKQRHISTPEFAGKYTRPTVLRRILKEINRLHPFVTVPIFKIQAVKL
jgi:SAM-dependent methyltransferase